MKKLSKEMFMIIQNNVFNGFMAALLHDMGKLILDNGGNWKKHYEMNVKNNPLLNESTIDFKKLLGNDRYQLAIVHHEPISVKNSPNIPINSMGISLEKISLFIGDKLQKGMHGIPEIDVPRNNPYFLPYYGEGIVWDKVISRKIIESIDEKFSSSSPLNLKKALDIQEYCTTLHTTYIPHISLSIHQRFSAVLYYFLHEKLKECSFITDLSELCFFVIQITPDPPNLLYRMKDVRIIKQSMEKLREYLLTEIFNEHMANLPEITKDANPFEFFSGDSIVLMYDDTDRLINKLQYFINQDQNIHVIHLNYFKYRLELKGSWSVKEDRLGFFSRPGEISVSESQITLLSTYLEHYQTITINSCSKCNKPTVEPVMDSKGDILCQYCWSGRKDLSIGINLEDVGKKREEIEKIGFISITIPEDIRSEAVRVAKEKLIPDFKKVKNIKIEIPTTNTGLFEYLQAVLDIGRFQKVLDEKIKTIQTIWETAAHVVYKSPNCALYLLREDYYWNFLWYTLEERKILHIPSSIKGVICDSHYPFWSLIDKLLLYTKEDIYYDASERKVVMFTDEEVMCIRQLANLARNERIPSAQLQILVQTAIRSSLEELIMEIDVREQDRKLGRSNFASRLISGLKSMKSMGEDYRDREKRSIFIKYISKLAR